MKLTASQERAAGTFGRDVCVRAGAGSGKTAVLVARAVRLLTREEDPLALGELLAITFTEKAAREMKQRLAEAMGIARGPEARMEVEWARISTIHGFCARVLRENALEAGVDPAFQVLDEFASETLLRQALEETARTLGADRPESVEALRLLSATDLEAEIRGLHAELRTHGVPPAKLPLPPPDPGAFPAALERACEDLREVAALAPAAPQKSVEKAARALVHLPFLQALEEPDREACGVIAGAAAAINLSVQKALKEPLKRLREESLPAALAAAAEVVARPGLLALRDFLAEMEERYRGAKEERGALDYSDLEILARNLLRDRAEVRETLRSRFRQVLVDEYQDVNPLQEEIVRLVSGPRRRFSVGDEKQSIYGFRGADPTLLKHFAMEVGEDGLVTLERNFRSATGLVQFANHLFGRLFEDDTLVRWSDMVPAREEPGADVEVLLVPGERVQDYREREARALASHIRGLVRSGEARFKEIAVLFRALTNVKIYERAFEDRGVPFYVVKGRGFYEAREVVDLARLLRCVGNPRDDLTLASTLRSPFAGLREDALLALTRARPEGGVLADLLAAPERVEGLAGEERESWLRFARLHRRLRFLADSAPLREVLEVALAESGYFTSVWLLHAGRRRAANLAKVLSIADAFEGDLPGFLTTLEDFRGREVNETEAPTGGEAEDVVRLLTVHAAKGLQFPVVYLPDLSRQAWSPSPDFLTGTAGTGVKLALRSAVATPTHTKNLKERKEREARESLRLLYVAVTRAEDRLVLSAMDHPRGPPAGSWWSSLASVFGAGEGVYRYGPAGREFSVRRPEEEEEEWGRRTSLLARRRESVVGGRPLLEADAEQHAVAEGLFARVDAPRSEPDGTAYENIVSELLLFSDCPARHYWRYRIGVPEEGRAGPEEDPEQGPADERPGTDELPAREAGILAHEVLSSYDPRGGESPAEVAHDRVVAQSGAANEPLARQVASMVESFYASPLGAEVLACDPHEVARELPFLVRWAPEEDRLGLILKGKMDLVFRRADGRVAVVDYKTGRADPSKYQVQLVAYARALAQFLSEEVTASLVYLAPGEPAREHPVVIDDGAVARMEDLVVEFARRMREDLPPEKGPNADCASCPYAEFCPFTG